jgi:RimJ/RimL family protein N-acetyltransferase
MFTAIGTARLILRRLETDDARIIHSYRNDPDVSRFQAWVPASEEEVRDFIERLSSREPITPGDWFQLGIESRLTGELIGDCGVHARPDECEQVELGITLTPQAQRKGFAAETLTAVLDYLFTQTATHRVFCSLDPRNKPCLSLLTKLGMRKEAHMKECLRLKNEWVDDMVFAILRTEWKKE